MSFFSKRHYHIVSVLYVLESADILRISRGRVDVYKNPAALTKHSMSRWAASPMAITATGSTWCDTLRLVWQLWLCVQRWNVVDMTHWYDVMSSWCDPDVLAHRNHTNTLLSIAALRKVYGDLVFHASQTCQPKNQRGRFFSKCIQNRQECYAMIPWIAILKIHDDFMLSSSSSYFIFQNQWE